MKIELGGGGGFFEPDEGPRNTRIHRRIVRTARIPNTKCGYWLELECGHRVMGFGKLERTEGIVRCDYCRAEEIEKIAQN